MTSPNNSGASVPGRVLAVLVSLLLVASAFGQTSDARTAPAPIERHMAKMRKVISNAKVKLKRGGGGGFSRQGSGTNATPGWSCCAANLKRVEKSVVAIQSMLLQLEYCYDDSGEIDALIAARLSKSDLQDLARSVQRFADAVTVPRAEQAMNGMFRTFLNLDESTIELPACGELVDPSLLESDESPTDTPAGD